jgi:hypothetical protein
MTYAGASSPGHPGDSSRTEVEIEDRPPTEGLALNGRGSLSWFGIKIYDATLWSERGNVGTYALSQRVALRIDYHRSIPVGRLVETTRKEWRRLAGSPEVPAQSQTEAWLAQVESIWRDVQQGDFILSVVEPGGATSFHGPEGLLGVLDDPRFGPAFLSIWLHPDTSRPDLRAALMGDTASES